MSLSKPAVTPTVIVRIMTYSTRDNQVFYNTIDDKEELFITVHPTDSSGVTLAQQAEYIAKLLNEAFT